MNYEQSVFIEKSITIYCKIKDDLPSILKNTHNELV